MNTPFFIARRYLFAKKSTNAINIISGISMAGVFVGSAALVIILSVFNGFEDMILKMFNTFTPNVLITPAKGKTFDANTVYFQNIKNDKQVEIYTETLSENAVLKYGERQAVGLIRGINSIQKSNVEVERKMVSGTYKLNSKDTSFISLGSTIQNYLMVSPVDGTSSVQLFSPDKNGGLNPMVGMANFNLQEVYVSGIFEVQQEFDNSAIVSMKVARELFSEPNKISAIEIILKSGTNEDVFIRGLKENLGEHFVVENRLEQNKALYSVLSSEKWMVFIILTFILIIAIFNIIGSLTMLVIEKKQDIQILNSLGATRGWIKRIFLIEGMMITLIGCVAGLFVGLLFCITQQKLGLISMGEAGLLTSKPYPIAIKFTDFALVFVTVTALSFIASALSANLSVKNIDQLKAAN